MKFERTIFITIVICTFVALLFSCNKEVKEELTEEIQTSKPISPKCNLVCDVNKNPDLQLVTNAEEDTLFADGTVDSNSYFWTKYHVRANPIRLTQNYVTPQIYTIRYGWDSGQVVNRVQLQCLIENIAPFGCGNDWVFTEDQGYLSPLNNYFFDGLFEFDTYEKGNGNSWKLLYTDYKKEFFPSSIPNVAYLYNLDFCYYERAVQAQQGDFYYNYFRFPNHDGFYKLVIKFNPSIKGCRAVKETNYDNNEKTIELEIKEGAVKIL